MKLLKWFIEKIKLFVERFHPSMQYEYCYTDREYEGIAAMGCCCGTVGGTKTTEYLSEMCVDCPHFVMLK